MLPTSKELRASRGERQVIMIRNTESCYIHFLCQPLISSGWQKEGQVSHVHIIDCIIGEEPEFREPESSVVDSKPTYLLLWRGKTFIFWGHLLYKHSWKTVCSQGSVPAHAMCRNRRDLENCFPAMICFISLRWQLLWKQWEEILREVSALVSSSFYPLARLNPSIWL